MLRIPVYWDVSLQSSVEPSASTIPMTQRHFSADPNPPQHRCENIKSSNFFAPPPPHTHTIFLSGCCERCFYACWNKTHSRLLLVSLETGLLFACGILSQIKLLRISEQNIKWDPLRCEDHYHSWIGKATIASNRNSISRNSVESLGSGVIKLIPSS
jgi:hypothetical protein